MLAIQHFYRHEGAVRMYHSNITKLIITLIYRTVDRKVAREASHCGQRGLPSWPERSATVAREACHCGQSGLPRFPEKHATVAREACHHGQRGLPLWPERPATVAREA